MLTAAECREKAADKLAQAERNIGWRKRDLQDAAAEWLMLASKMEESPAERDSVDARQQVAPRDNADI